MPSEHRVQDDLRWAADFDPSDPRLGLNWEDLSSDRASRRAFLRLAIGAGALAPVSTLLGPVSAAAQGRPGGELKMGWMVREFANLDPAYQNAADFFRVGSNFPTKAKFNGFCYSNAEVDRLNAAQRRTVDVAARAQLVHKVIELVARDAPGVFLYHPKDVVAHRKNVKGFTLIPGLRDLDTVTVR
jgi:hypothetical protein